MAKLVVSSVNLGAGGAERVLSVLSSALCCAFDDVTFVLWRTCPQFYRIDEKVKIVYIEKETESVNVLKKILWFRCYLNKVRPDLVLSFLTPFNMLTLVSTVGLNVPVVVAERNDPRYMKGGMLVQSICKLLYRRAKGILCQTKCIKDYFSGSLAKKAHIIYNPISLKSEWVGFALTQTKVDKIVSIGRLTEQKKQSLMIDGFCAFHKTHPTYFLEIYGEGELKEQLLHQIQENKAENFIFLRGHTSDVISVLGSAKAFILTSRNEGMSNAMIEAMVLGVPTISTYVSGAIDLISNRENGILIDGNVVDICDALSAIVDDDDYANMIGKNGAGLYNTLEQGEISRQWIDYLLQFIKNK